jgi:hypothetical protein
MASLASVYEWQTPARQSVRVCIVEGNLHASLSSMHGEVLEVPPMMLSHLQHWWKAETMMHEQLNMANQSREKLLESVVESDPGAPQGIGLRFDALRKYNHNVAATTSVRDIALQRALLAADKAMIARVEAAPKYTGAGVILAPWKMLVAAHAVRI